MSLRPLLHLCIHVSAHSPTIFENLLGTQHVGEEALKAVPMVTLCGLAFAQNEIFTHQIFFLYQESVS